jgi:hypothetical protein
MNSIVTAIVTVCERVGPIAALHRGYAEALAELGVEHEFVYVLDGPYPEVAATLDALRAEGQPITVVQLSRWYGEAAAVTLGLEHAHGDRVVLLPAYQQVNPASIGTVVAALDEADVVQGRRYPRHDHPLNQLQGRLFNSMVRGLIGDPFSDLGCAVRAGRRQALRELHIYGDQHRFLPILAARQGLRVREVTVMQAAGDAGRRLYRPGVYLRRMLDLLAVLFIAKFTVKPLRFFGLIGMTLSALGGAVLAYLLVDKVVFGHGLADRSAVIIGVLPVVLGVQILALGLIGEIIVFTRGKQLRSFQVDRVLRGGSASAPAGLARTG